MSIWRANFPNAVCMFFIVIMISCNQNVDYKDDAEIVNSNFIVKKLSNNENVILKDKTIKGLLNFTSVNFQKFYGTVYIEPVVYFENCIFEDSVCASSQSEKCVFSKKVIFKDCHFIKGVGFNNVEFKDDYFMDLSKIDGVAAFNGTFFRSKSSFASVNFLGNTTFSGTVFFMETSFNKSLFKKDCIFHFARFNNFARFMESYFYGYTDFSQIFSGSILDFTAAKFSGETLMSYSTLLGDVLFSNCRFKQKPELKENAVLGEIILKNIDGEIPDITNNKMFNQLNFSKK